MPRAFWTLRGLTFLVATLILGGCVGPRVDPPPDFDQDLGFGPEEIQKMTDQMVADILTRVNEATPPRIIIDTRYLRNDGHQPVDKGLIVQRLRTGLMNAANGRLIFVTSDAPADYILSGAIKAMSSANPSTGVFRRFHQFSFQILDMNTRELKWSGIYEVNLSAKEDTIYR